MAYLECENQDHQYNLEHPELNMSKKRDKIQESIMDSLSYMSSNMESAENRKLDNEIKMDKN